MYKHLGYYSTLYCLFKIPQLKLLMSQSQTSEFPRERTETVPIFIPQVENHVRYTGPVTDTLSINFYNIHGLNSKFLSVTNPLSSTEPHLLFLTKTWVSETADISVLLTYW